MKKKQSFMLMKNKNKNQPLSKLGIEELSQLHEEENIILKGCC